MTVVYHINVGRVNVEVVSEKCVDQKQRALAIPYHLPYRVGMKSNKTELAALKRLISETDLILSTTVPLPENRTARCRELLGSALALTDDLLTQAKLPAAAILGHRGGTAIAKRGSDYFRKLAAKRKTFGGGRPRKSE